MGTDERIELAGRVGGSDLIPSLESSAPTPSEHDVAKANSPVNGGRELIPWRMPSLCGLDTLGGQTARVTCRTHSRQPHNDLLLGLEA